MSRYDYLVVLGYPNANAVQWKIFLSRMNATLDIYKKRRPLKVIVTGGGTRTRTGCTEAEEMYDFLAERGIPKSKIIREKKSKNTMENAYFIKPLIRKKGYVVVVASDFSIPRATYIFRKFYGKTRKFEFAEARTDKHMFQKARRFEDVSFDYAKILLKGINERSSKAEVIKVLEEKRKNPKTPEMVRRSWY